MKKIIIINGPNINLTGKREENIYGIKSYEDINKDIGKIADSQNIDIEIFQSNSEGKIIDKIQECMKNFDFLIINPGALTHYSYSIHDAIAASNIPAVEVHMSNIYKRDEWRRKSVISPAVIGTITGLGSKVYDVALTYAIQYLK